MSRLVSGILILLLVVASAAIPLAAADQPTKRVQTPAGFDETTFRVTVNANGSATWAIEHQTPLANESEREQFETFATEFEQTESQLYTNFIEQAGILTRVGTNATGREMTATNFQRSAGVDPVQSVGTVRMSFRWTNFARVSGERIIVNDVFDGGFYIGESQSLVFERGPTVSFADVQPAPDSISTPDSLSASKSVTWNGEESFNDRRPYVEFAPRSATDGETPANPGAQTPTETPINGEETPAESGGSQWLMGLAVLILILGIGGAVAWRTGIAATILGTDGSRDETGSPDSTQTTGPNTADSEAVSSDPEPAVEDDELLTDSDRVRKLLEENGGRMKQVNIVDNTDWSKSKVSMLLSEMEEDGEISKLRVGRENIISLSGEEPDAAGSPFDDE